MKKIKLAITIMLSFMLLFVGNVSIVEAKEDCNVSFVVTDQTDGYSGQINITMKDTDGVNVFNYALTKGNSWGSSNIPKYSVRGDVFYNISIDGMDDGYKLVNEDGTDITGFDASSDVDFKWKIISVTENNLQKNEYEDSISVKKDEDSSVSISKNVETKNKEADKLFNDFLEKASVMKNDDRWEQFLSSYELYADNKAISNAQDYVDTTGGKKEDYLNMSSFDKFIYYETYIRQAEYLTYGNWERYYGSEDNYLSRVVGPTINLLELQEQEIGDMGITDSYKALMHWQYEYIVENDCPYNFIEGKNYFESRDETEKNESLSDNQNNSTENEEEANDGIWNGVINILSRNKISLTVFFALVGIFIGVKVYMKRRNIDSDSSNK